MISLLLRMGEIGFLGNSRVGSWLEEHLKTPAERNVMILKVLRNDENHSNSKYIWPACFWFFKFNNCSFEDGCSKIRQRMLQNVVRVVTVVRPGSPCPWRLRWQRTWLPSASRLTVKETEIRSRLWTWRIK